MLTAKCSETGTVLGLDLGADDYMTKAFSVHELQVGLRSQLRKVHVSEVPNNSHFAADDRPLVIGTLYSNQKNHQVVFQLSELELTATEFELPHKLCQPSQPSFQSKSTVGQCWAITIVDMNIP